MPQVRYTTGLALRIASLAGGQQAVWTMPHAVDNWLCTNMGASTKIRGAAHLLGRGDKLCSMGEVAHVNELLCKVLCHNIYCVIQSVYKVGIEPALNTRPSGLLTVHGSSLSAKISVSFKSFQCAISAPRNLALMPPSKACIDFNAFIMLLVPFSHKVRGRTGAST